MIKHIYLVKQIQGIAMFMPFILCQHHTHTKRKMDNITRIGRTSNKTEEKVKGRYINRNF